MFSYCYYLFLCIRSRTPSIIIAGRYQPPLHQDRSQVCSMRACVCGTGNTAGGAHQRKNPTQRAIATRGIGRPWIRQSRMASGCSP